MENKQAILNDAIEMAKEVGRMQMEKFRSQRLQMTTKGWVSDVVTEVDKACEDYLLKTIAQKYPNHSVLGEETGAHNNENSKWQWVVDPLDGTNNYSQGLPIFGVSLGVTFEGITQVGVVFIPVLNDMFTAVRGEGAFWNGERIHVSEKTDLAECLLATGFPYDKHLVGSDKNNLDNVCSLLPKLRGLLRMGAAAYDLCCTACGLLDGYWELNIKPWDACAGSLIVEEAGGIVVSIRDDRNISIAAGNKTIVEKILQSAK